MTIEEIGKGIGAIDKFSKSSNKEKGALVGAGIGSIVPGIGTAVGTIIGTFVGGLIKGKTPHVDTDTRWKVAWAVANAAKDWALKEGLSDEQVYPYVKKHMLVRLEMPRPDTRWANYWTNTLSGARADQWGWVELTARTMELMLLGTDASKVPASIEERISWFAPPYLYPALAEAQAANKPTAVVKQGAQKAATALAEAVPFLQKDDGSLSWVTIVVGVAGLAAVIYAVKKYAL